MPPTARAKELPSENLSLEEQIQRRAYELYVKRGNQSGSELDESLNLKDSWLGTQRGLLRAVALAR